MTPERPASVTVIAFFHFIIGGLGLLCNLCSMAGAVGGGGVQGGVPFQSSPKQVEMQKAMEAMIARDLPAYQVINVVSTLASVVLAIMLISAGIGLMQMAPWGRTLSIAYGGVSLALKVFGAVYTILFLVPVLDNVMQLMMPQVRTAQDRKLLETIMTFAKGAVYVGACLPMIYPVVVLLVMGQTSVREAFEGGRPTGNDFDDGFDRGVPRRPGDEGPPGLQPGPPPEDRGPPDDRFRQG
jgi:hypothetical protein